MQVLILAAALINRSDTKVGGSTGSHTFYCILQAVLLLDGYWLLKYFCHVRPEESSPGCGSD